MKSDNEDPAAVMARSDMTDETPRTPTTAAGRALLSCVVDGEWRSDWSAYGSLDDSILAIEAEAALTPAEPTLDVERLAVAIRKVERENDLRDDTELGVKPMDGPPPHWYEGYAAAIAAAYEGSKE